MAVTTKLYDPAVNSDPLSFGFLAYAQLPTFPIYPFPPTTELSNIQSIYSEMPSLLDTATATASGITLDTDGSVFDGVDGFVPLSFLSFPIKNGEFEATANTGYSGFTNYTINLDGIDPNNISLEDLDGLADSLTLESVNPSFPVLDPDAGFSLTFDLTILQETSEPNRAGFSLVLVTNDTTRDIEIGFREDGLFAQGQNFQAGNFVALDLTQTRTFSLEVAGSAYSLDADGVEVLSGSLLDYAFDPTTSSPPFPEEANPYNIPNFLFFGDNTDNAHAEFTLGAIAIATAPVVSQASGPLFDYEQFLRFQNPAAIAPGDTVDGLPLAQLFDEHFYLNNNSDVAAGVNGGSISSGYDHFVAFGQFEGRNPSVLFDDAFYLSTHSDVAQAVAGGALPNGLQHFLLFGHREGRTPSSQFSQQDYLTGNPDVASAIDAGAFGSAFEHYIEFGIDEGRSPRLALFEEAFYRQNNPDVASAIASGFFTDGFEHFVRFGQQEGRIPSPNFSEAAYLGLNPDVQSAVDAGIFTSGFEHYEKFGRFENRSTVEPLNPLA